MAKGKFWESAIANHILQFIFIFSSVYFAFWLTEKNEVRKLRQLERQAVEGVYRELQTNLAGLRESIPYHLELSRSIQVYADSLQNLPPAQRDTKTPVTHLMQILTRSNNTLGTTQLRSTAWRFLENSEAFALLDYEVASQLSSTYQVQEDGVLQTARLLFHDVFSSKDLFRPEENRAVLGLAQVMIRELQGQEVFLAEQIEKRLELLQANYDDLE